MTNNDFKQTIIVTGGLGFIGSNYLNKFVPLYPDRLFINIDAETYAANHDNLTIESAPNYKFIKVDIRDLAGLRTAFEQYRPGVVLNFAAETHVDKSITGPTLFIETNILGTHNLLALSSEFKSSRFHQVSTDEVYGSLGPDDSAFTTGSPLLPNSPYSASKAAADLLVRSYLKTFGLSATISRCSNNYGPNQDQTKLIPKFISLLLAGAKVPLYARGENVRDWIFVEDHIDAIDLILQKGEIGKTYNIGGDCELKNIEIVKKLLALTGRDDSYIEFIADRPGHDFRYAIDNTEIEKELGWKPKYNFATGLTKTFEFYRLGPIH